MTWLLDQFSLRPTRHPIELEDGERQEIPVDGNSVELIIQSRSKSKEDVDLVVCKFVGAGGRAENFSTHPLDQWCDLRGVVCAVNPPGFGNSTGRASLARMATSAEAAVRHMQDQYPNARLLLMGSSLGAAVALHVAARNQPQPIHGLILRDPPQLYDVIMQRFGWWTGWLPAWLVARRTPPAFDAYKSAANCHVPALFVSSRADTIVPPDIHDRIIASYAGPRDVMALPNTDHSQPISESELERYADCLQRFRAALE